jgi:hypothetical protein
MLERDAIAEAARALEIQGFRIVGQPAASETIWRPDLLAVRDGQVWAVEIKRAGVRISEEEINRLQELSDRQGWRLALWQLTPEGQLAKSWGDLQPDVPPDREEDDLPLDLLRWVDACQQIESGLRLIAALDNQDDYLRRVLEERRWGPEDEPLRRRHDPTARWPDLLANLAVAGYVDPGERVLFLGQLDARDRLLRGSAEEPPSPTVGEARRLLNALRNVITRASESWVNAGGVLPGRWQDEDIR